MHEKKHLTPKHFWCNGSWTLNATLIKLDQSIKGGCETKTNNKKWFAKPHRNLQGRDIGTTKQHHRGRGQNNRQKWWSKNRSTLEKQNKSGIDKLISSDAIDKKWWQFKPSLRRQRQRGEPTQRSVLGQTYLGQRSWNWHFGAEESGEIHVLGA